MILRIKDAERRNWRVLPETDPDKKSPRKRPWPVADESGRTGEQSTGGPRGDPDLLKSQELGKHAARTSWFSPGTFWYPQTARLRHGSGQVYNPTAVAYRPGKSAKWYLSQGGGPTNLANKKAIFVIRADGTVIGSHGSPWFLDDTLAEYTLSRETRLLCRRRRWAGRHGGTPSSRWRRW